MLAQADFRQAVEMLPLVSIDLLLRDANGRYLTGLRTNPPARRPDPQERIPAQRAAPHRQGRTGPGHRGRGLEASRRVRTLLWHQFRG
jgi:hypothetical protein